MDRLSVGGGGGLQDRDKNPIFPIFHNSNTLLSQAPTMELWIKFCRCLYGRSYLQYIPIAFIPTFKYIHLSLINKFLYCILFEGRSMKKKEKLSISFIGLGIMGKPMAKNLLKASYPLLVHNRSKDPVEELVKIGARKANTPKQAAENSDIIITMLPNSPDVESVVLGENGIIEGARKGQILIDMSSIEPLVSQQIAGELGKKGMEMLDAPVSGGEPGAIKGELAIMVGGKEKIFKKCLPIFEMLGKSAVLVGEIGAGGFAKLANQIIVAMNIAAVSEAFVLGQKAGLNSEKLFQAIKGGLAGSNVMDAKIPKISERNFNPGFKIKLHDKDIKNVLKTGTDLQVPLPLTEVIEQIMKSLLTDGKGELDHGGMVQYFEKLAGVEVSTL